MTVSEWLNTAVRRWGPTATIAGTLGVRGSFAVAGFTVSFVAAPVNTWVVEHTPAILVTATILLLSSLGETLAFAVALLLSATALAVSTLVGASVGDRIGDTAGAVLGTYFAGWTVVMGLMITSLVQVYVFKERMAQVLCGLGAPGQHRDPVCGVRTDDGGPSIIHDGETYYFCSKWGKQSVEDEPRQFFLSESKSTERTHPWGHDHH